MLFKTVNNDIVIGSVFLIGTWCSIMLLRLIYLISDQSSWMTILPNWMRRMLPRLTLFPASFSFLPHHTLLVYGHRALRALAAAYVVLSCILMLRVHTAIYDGQFWSPMSLSKSWFVCLRVFLAAITGVIIHHMNSHFMFRWIVCLFTPALLIMDLMSEIGVLVEYNCALSDDCSNVVAGTVDLGPSDVLEMLVWRDCAAGTVGLMLLAFTYWQAALWGIVSDDIVIPRYEHREYMAQLEKQRARQRERDQLAKEERELKDADDAATSAVAAKIEQPRQSVVTLRRASITVI